MIRKAFHLIIMIVLLLSSCRPQAEISSQETDIETWGDLFRNFWDKMNMQYVFWDLDSPQGEWDDVYDEYSLLFDAIDGGIGESEDSTDKACRYFYDIVKKLSDCHYSLKIYDGGNEEPVLTFSKYFYNLLHSSGYDDETIYGFFRTGNVPEVSDLRKTIESVITDSFGMASLPAGFSGYIQPRSYLSECYVFTSPGEASNCYALGRTEDGILYIGLSDFSFTLYLTGIGSEALTDAVSDFISTWQSWIQDYLAGTGEEIKGIVVDLRGNTGGFNADIPTLWSYLIAEDVHICDYRGKDGMNRTDYGPWVKYIVKHDENTKRNFDKPIAVLTNKATISNGEISTLFFKALGDYYGFDIASFGEATAGGLGTANSSLDGNIHELFDPYPFNAGQFNIGYAACTTQNRYARYRNGEVDENRGIEPDYPVEESRAGDNVLSSALDWIRGN